MFERRLKIFIAVLVLVSLGLLSRVFEVQVVAHSYWSKQAIGMLTKPQITETTRGRILDIHGNPMAVDTACTDACVDYRAIIDPPDPVWLKEIVSERLRTKLGAEYRGAKPDQKKQMLADETQQTLADINSMWDTLAELNPQAAGNPNPRAMIEEIRRSIVQSVRARRQSLSVRNQQRDQKRASTASTLMRWLASSESENSADNVGTLEEEQEPHVVLPALDSEGCNFLGKRLEDFPGLVLRASTHRTYPMKTIACHLLGNLSQVSAADLEDSRRANLDELRQYLPNDVIGRNGIEALCEPLLRGSRGKIEKRVSDDAIIAQQDFVPGDDVRLTIDASLQQKAQDLLQHVEEQVVDTETREKVPATPPGGVSMHGAIVVLDVNTSEVRVLASNPGFDLNELQDHYAALASDELNQPLTNRATSDTCEPGSTVKPLMGLGAITQGVLAPQDSINCTGYLYLPEIDSKGVSHQLRIPGSARCWILSENVRAQEYMKENHTSIPPDWAMHHELNFSGALERSCDVFFETVADRLQPTGVDYWMRQFGLGRPTGIGIFERPGLRPALYRGTIENPRANNCLSGMGQGSVLATPLQIANVAATIARGGIWMRPRLLSADTQSALDAVHPRSDSADQIDLHLSPQALEQARLGMVSVVDGPAATGKIDHPGFTLAAKTGTADTASLWVKTRDTNGKPVSQKLVPVYRHGEESATPWYRSGNENGFGVVHAWYMGYAPAENPQVAFCVLIEYAGAGGGVAAGPVASQMLEACLHAGYLHAQ